MAWNWFLNLISRVRPSVSHPAVSLDEERARASRKLGNRGEQAAVKLLSKKGYRILERNFNCRGGEIDIIAEHKGCIAFVEVKTRSPRSWNSPESAITSEKQVRIKRAAAYYLASFRHSLPVRYDTVSVLTDDQNTITSVELKQNAFGELSEVPIES